MMNIWDTHKKKPHQNSSRSECSCSFWQEEFSLETEQELQLSFKGNVHLDKPPGLSSKAVMKMKNGEALTKLWFMGSHYVFVQRISMIILAKSAG